MRLAWLQQPSWSYVSSTPQGLGGLASGKEVGGSQPARNRRTDQGCCSRPVPKDPGGGSQSYSETCISRSSSLLQRSLVLKTDLTQGTSRVGNAAELSLARRVQLAVIAHIRHEYTDYDKLLKTGTYLEARAKVEPASLEQLRKWRGENDDGPVELEDVFREIIVLDDDADSDDSDDGSSSDGPADERAPSVEIISSQAAGHDLRAEDVFGAQQRVVDDAGQVLRRAYIALPRPRPAVTAHSPRMYSTQTGQPDDIIRRPFAPDSYLPRPSDHRLYARLAERSARAVRYMSPALESHIRTQQGKCTATYP